MRSWLEVSVLCSVISLISCGGEQTNPDRSEDAYRANNHGVALLEQFDYQGAAESFREASALNAALGTAHLRSELVLPRLHPDRGDAARRQLS